MLHLNIWVLVFPFRCTNLIRIVLVSVNILVIFGSFEFVDMFFMFSRSTRPRFCHFRFGELRNLKNWNSESELENLKVIEIQSLEQDRRLKCNTLKLRLWSNQGMQAWRPLESSPQIQWMDASAIESFEWPNIALRNFGHWTINLVLKRPFELHSAESFWSTL